MRKKLLKFTLFLFLCMISMHAKSHVENEIEDRHVKVVMRMVGHEILLQSGDSTSRVLPVEKELGRYKIHFESKFEFDPENLVTTVDSIIKKTNLASSYIVEIEACDSSKILYSYEVGMVEKTDIIPCKGRKLPKDCYELYISILHTHYPNYGIKPIEKTKNSEFKFVWLTIPVVFILGLFFYYSNKKNDDEPEVFDPDLITVGSYLFDKRNMTLTHGDEKTELTSKESDLLFLLFSSANSTLERDHLLRVVWGDEGDYIGRTLDVFISKLRKKLAGDENLKIINIRGVGYKFVVNQAKV